MAVLCVRSARSRSSCVDCRNWRPAAAASGPSPHNWGTRWRSPSSRACRTPSDGTWYVSTHTRIAWHGEVSDEESVCCCLPMCHRSSCRRMRATRSTACLTCPLRMARCAPLPSTAPDAMSTRHVAPPPSSSPRRDASTLTRVTCLCLQVGGPAPPARLRIEPNHQIISDYVSDSEVRQALTPPAAPIMHVR